MKKWMLIFAVLLVYASNALGDSGPPAPTHIVTTDVLITNLDQYPDIVLLTYSASGGSGDVHVVGQNQPLPKGSNSYFGFGFGVGGGTGARNLLAIHKNILEAEGGVEAIDVAVLRSKYTPAAVIAPGDSYVNDSSPVVSQTYKYRITGVTADTVSLKLYEGVFNFNDGREPRVVSY